MIIGTVWALIPIVATLFLAFKWKNVFLALLTGMLLSGIILLIDTGDCLATFNSIPNALGDSYFVKSILFLFLTGAIMNVVSKSAAVALLFPVLLPLAYQMGVPFEFVIGAIVSGAVFGDQNSPISDSVILTTTVTDTKIMDHVKTQLPFTGVALGLASIAFIVLTFIA